MFLGQLAFVLVESLAGKPIPRKAKEVIQALATSLLLGLGNPSYMYVPFISYFADEISDVNRCYYICWRHIQSFEVVLNFTFD